MLDRLPPSLQQHILLEWLSPSEVHIIASQTGNTSLRRAVLTSPCSFRAAPCEILNDACVRWFHYHRHKLRLVLWTTVERNPQHDWNYGGWVESVFYRSNGKLHRDDDLPAIDLGSTLMWYQHGKLHRDDDKPALTRANQGEWEWYQNGGLHRDDDKPAVVWANGDKFWYQHGRLHRDDDKPAVVWANGTVQWWKHGTLAPE